MAPARRIEANGLAFAVLDEGQGAPVLLLHGFPDTHALWRNQVPALTGAGFRAIAPDLRGRGASDAPRAVEAYAIEHLVADAAGILDALAVERAHVVGHDWGAIVGWELAARRPERVERLVALSVGHPAAMPRRSARELRKKWYVLMFQFPEAPEALRRDGWRLFREWSGDALDCDRYIADLSRPGRLEAGLSWYRANLHPAALLADAPSSPEVRAPTMGVWGTFDVALTEEQMTASAEHVAGQWRYERLEGVGHWSPLEAPERINALLLEFLAPSAATFARH